MQLNIFESSIMERYKIENHVRLIELFAGIGAQHKALEILSRNGYIPFGYEAYKICEFDKYAVDSYNAVHGTNFETSDITKIHAKDLEIVDRDKHTYIMCYSFPCTDLSNAGKMAGMRKGTGTRSGLLWEVERLLNECGNELPQVLVMENVPAVESEKNINDFRDWLHYLSSKGYHNFEQICNATEIGYPEPIPQNRKRCFMVSILDDKVYSFPEKRKLRKKLKDLLEEEVDDKYYLSEKMINYIVSKDDAYKVNDGNLVINRDIACAKTTREGTTRADCSDYVVQGLKEENVNLTKPSFQEVYDKIKNSSFTQASKRLQENDICDTLLARDYKDPKCVVDKKSGYSCEVSEEKTDTENHGQVTAIAIKNATKQGYLLAEDGDGIDISGRMETHRGTVQKQTSLTLKTSLDVGVCVKKYSNKRLNETLQANEVKDKDFIDAYNRTITSNVSGTITTRVDASNNVFVADFKNDRGPEPYYQTNSLSIRKLTPKECWRLMGFEDEDYERASKVNSNTQLYKQAGNSIVVNCLAAIFKEMF
jgi:DNA (cytosine-5)-methyltransferase 1